MFDAAYVMEIASQLVRAALDAGADDAEVYLRHGPSVRITLQYGHINESSGWQSGLALRVWRGGRLALLTTNDIAPGSLLTLARQAIVEARQRGVMSHPWLREGQEPLVFPAADEEMVPSEAKVVLLERVLAAGSTQGALRRTIQNACYSDSTFWTALVNSRGFAAAYLMGHYRIWCWVEGPTSHTVVASSSRRFAELASDSLEQHLNERAAFLEQPVGQAPDGLCEVLLPPLAAADLARSLGALLTAENVLRELKPLLKRMDRPIAAPAVTLIDDGIMAAGLKSRPIDDEGTPTSATTLIERGQLRGLLHTLSSAAQMGVPPNGKATRTSLWQLPSGAPSNIYFQAGDAKSEDLRAQMRHGLIVVSLLRPGRIQSTTGKFTTIAQGWWVEPGAPPRPVSGVPLSAQIFELLRNVRRCGADLEFSSLADGAGAPSLLIERMRVG